MDQVSNCCGVWRNQEVNVTPAERYISAVLGGGLVVAGLRHVNLPGLILLGLGALALELLVATTLVVRVP